MRALDDASPMRPSRSDLVLGTELDLKRLDEGKS